MTYIPALRDIRFCLDHIVGQPDLYAGGFPDFDADLRDAVLEAAGQLASEVLSPLNVVGDQQGAKLENGQVVLSPGFTEAIKTYAEGGWNGLAADPEYGGQALPKSLEQACFEMFHAANMAFTLMPTLSQGAIEAIHTHGSEAQKAYYLPKLISGAWSGTMNLTEPQAGSDLAALTTRAEPDVEGYRLFGTKIFITWGDHEAVDNIVHLVLARLPDATAGTRGISLFVCPKFLPDEAGNLTERNAAKCVGLEHKLGIHASPTCVMAFEGAKAELVGEPHGGLKAMFTMMNAARLAVGFEAVGLAEAAFQKANTYARERRQGRSVVTGEGNAPIYDHPDVRLMLALAKAKSEAARAICLLTATEIDRGNVSAGDAQARHKRREDFLVPIAKAWSTDVGVEVASLGVQVHGGMGYVEETGAAQFYRDARIAPIYEGTNGIQAADLVGRKLGNDGKAAKELAVDISAFIEQVGHEQWDTEASQLTAALKIFDDATHWLVARKSVSDEDVAAAASTYLKLSGDIIGGWLLLKGAVAAQSLIDKGEGDAQWLGDRVHLMRIYYAHVLSHAPAHLNAIQSGYEALRDLRMET